MPGGIPTLAGCRPVVWERGQGWPTLRLLTCACAAMRAVRQETTAETSPAPLRALCVIGLCGHRSAAMRNITLARGTVQTRSASFACRHRGTRPCCPAVTCACATSARRRAPPANPHCASSLCKRLTCICTRLLGVAAAMACVTPGLASLCAKPINRAVRSVRVNAAASAG
jgi:hypothetical protein